MPWPAWFRRGFEAAEPPTLIGVAVLTAWYGTISGAAVLGFRMGRAVPVVTLLEGQASDREYYYLFTALGLLGVVATYVPLLLDQPLLVWAALTGENLNLLRLTTPYAPGPHTLRYATAVSGGAALHRMLWQRRITPLEPLNLLLLLLAAAFASRLTFILAIVVGLTLVLRDDPRWRPRPLALVLVGTAAFLILTPLNYYRNAPYYRDRGVSNPVLMNASEIVAYVGAPFQASVLMANRALEASGPDPSAAPGDFLHYMLPTYVPGHGSLSPAATDGYRRTADVEPSLTTNSVFVDMLPRLGWGAFPFMAIAAAVAAAFMGHLSNYRGFLFVLVGIVGYAFLEIWRVYLFNAGVLHFPALVLGGYALLKGLLRAPRPAWAVEGDRLPPSAAGSEGGGET